MSDKLEIDKQSESVIKDATELLKNDFVALYEGLGYDKTKAGLAWHAIRVSPKGRAAMDALKLPKHIQAKTMIDVKEEVAARTSKKGKKDKVAAAEEEVAEAPKAKKEKVAKDKKVAKQSADGSERGQKTAIAKELIAKGEKDAKIIAEKSGAAIAYVRTLLYNSRKKA